MVLSGTKTAVQDVEASSWLLGGSAARLVFDHGRMPHFLAKESVFKGLAGAILHALLLVGAGLAIVTLPQAMIAGRKLRDDRK